MAPTDRCDELEISSSFVRHDRGALLKNSLKKLDEAICLWGVVGDAGRHGGEL